MKTTKKPINCESAKEIMFDYLDGVASKTEASSLEYHISSCEDCKKELDERKNILDTVKLTAVDPPKGLKNSVMAKIGNIPQEKAGWRFIPSSRTVSALAIAACAVIMLAVGFRSMLFSDIAVDGEPKTNEGNTVYTSSIPALSTAAVRLTDAYAHSVKEADASGLPSKILEITTYGSATIDGDADNNSIKISMGESGSQIEKVYDDAVSSVDDNVGIVVGYADSFAGIISENEESEVEFAGLKCESYTVTENCVALAAQLLKGEIVGNAPWRVYLPSGVEISELQLIILEK